jgi:hypothetical protein
MTHPELRDPTESSVALTRPAGECCESFGWGLCTRLSFAESQPPAPPMRVIVDILMTGGHKTVGNFFLVWCHPPGSVVERVYLAPELQETHTIEWFDDAPGYCSAGLFGWGPTGTPVSEDGLLITLEYAVMEWGYSKFEIAGCVDSIDIAPVWRLVHENDRIEF